MSIGNFPEMLSQQILAGIILIGRLRAFCATETMSAETALADLCVGRSSGETCRGEAHATCALLFLNPLFANAVSENTVSMLPTFLHNHLRGIACL